MIVVRQHGDDGALFDMHCFLDDVEQLLQVDRWTIQIEECIGVEAPSAEDSCDKPKEYSTKGLKTLYSQLTQTIDGVITGYDGPNKIVRFEAVDSSYWEIRCRSKDFLDHMLSKYGPWKLRTQP